jgi:uncharacterized protein with ATP-grasp and redox domains
MKMLQPIPQCIDCLMSLAKSATALAATDNPKLAFKVESAARKILEDAKDNNLSSPQIASRILREVQCLTGVSDPYKQFKAQEMEQAKKVYYQMQDRVAADLRSRVCFAILGNSLDFFKNPQEALAEIPAQMREGISFYYDDVDKLAAFLANKPRLILYLTVHI